MGWGELLGMYHCSMQAVDNSRGFGVQQGSSMTMQFGIREGKG
jgi:hypothetical protein